jgi:hypothetical protein
MLCRLIRNMNPVTREIAAFLGVCIVMSQEMPL